jgi:NNP family nitrate/nitrite transporter-like MFS transporter
VHLAPETRLVLSITLGKMDTKYEAIEHKLDAIRDEVEHLHDSLESRGVNSRQVKDSLRGEVFALPVDQEHKARVLSICKCAVPHMRGACPASPRPHALLARGRVHCAHSWACLPPCARAAFHAAWIGFFSTFFSTFAPAPLAATLKKDTTLGLTRIQLQYGNLASVTANIVCRFLMGIVCDKLGARRGLAFVLLVCCPGIIGIMFVQSAAGFIACRAVIGVGLASFVACQVWCTQQFSKSIVGVANATAGGWGNLGGGITNLCMPFVFLFFMSVTGDKEDTAWRLCFLVPLALHLGSAAFALTGRDLPDGNFSELEMSGAKQKGNAGLVAKLGISNINAWILTVTYGFCFGVELTMTNVAVPRRHGLDPRGVVSRPIHLLFGVVRGSRGSRSIELSTLARAVAILLRILWHVAAPLRHDREHLRPRQHLCSLARRHHLRRHGQKVRHAWTPVGAVDLPDA